MQAFLFISFHLPRKILYKVSLLSIVGFAVLCSRSVFAAAPEVTYFKVENQDHKYTGYTAKKTWQEDSSQGIIGSHFVDLWETYDKKGKLLLQNWIEYRLNPVTFLGSQIVDLREDSSGNVKIKNDQIEIWYSQRGKLTNYQLAWNSDAVYFDLLPYRIKEQQTDLQLHWEVSVFSPLVVVASKNFIKYIPFELTSLEQTKLAGITNETLRFEINSFFIKSLLPKRLMVYEFSFDGAQGLSQYKFDNHTYTKVDKPPTFNAPVK